MTSLVDVSQADREAAAALCSYFYPGMVEAGGAVIAGRQDDHPAAQAFARHRLTAEQANAAEIATLFDAIAHGDEDHRAWLKEAIDAHFAGRPVPEPRGKGRKEAEIAELTALLREARIALAPFADDDPAGIREHHLIDAERAYRKLDTILNKRERDNATG